VRPFCSGVNVDSSSEHRAGDQAIGGEKVNQSTRPYLKYWVGMVLLAIFSVWFAANPASNQTCTILTAAYDGNVLFANNEDWHSPDPVIGFSPASAEGFGSVHVGFRHSDGSIEFGGEMNEQGLAWDINSLPKSALNPHPERPYSHETDNYLSTITKEAATVEEAIRIAHDFDFGDSMSLQIHIADASGDAVVISAGPDEEIAFTRKAPGDGYLVSTNFNLANPENGTKGWRYETATSMLEAQSTPGELSMESVGEILEAVHLNNLTSYTLYSNIFDLQNGKIHLAYLSQYGEWVALDLAEELSKGERIVEMRDLFTADTVDAGQSAYRRFETRFTMAKIAVVAAVLILVTGITVVVVKSLRKQRRVKATSSAKR
jgi:hypothetical protein